MSTVQKKTLRSRLAAYYSASVVRVVPQQATALAAGKGGSRLGESGDAQIHRCHDENHSATTAERNFFCLHEEGTCRIGLRHAPRGPIPFQMYPLPGVF